MKKKILVLLLIVTGIFVTACGDQKPKKSAQEMLTKYTDSVMKADREGLLSILPSFLKGKFGERYTQEFLNEYLNELKEHYGDDVTATAVVKGELDPTDEEFEAVKEYLSGFENYKEPKKCVVVDGYFELKGNIKEDKLDFAKSIAYCNFGDEWALIFG